MKSFNEWLDDRRLLEYEVYVDDEGYAHNDEGEVEFVGKQYAGQTFGLHDMPRGVRETRPRVEGDPKQVEALKKAIMIRPNDFLNSILGQVQQGRTLSEAQKKAIRQNFYRLSMRGEADLFR